MVERTATLHTALLICALAAVPGLNAHAQTFPAKPVRFIVPFATVDVVNKIAADAGRLAASAEMKERMLALGAEPVASSPERFTAFIRDEIDKWGKFVRASGARAD